MHLAVASVLHFPLPAETFHTMLEIITPVGAMLLAWIGMLIRTSLLEIKISQKDAAAKLLEGQTAVKEDLNEKHAENTRVIAVHVAEDRVQFAHIEQQNANQNRALERIETLIRNGHSKS